LGCAGETKGWREEERAGPILEEKRKWPRASFDYMKYFSYFANHFSKLQTKFGFRMILVATLNLIAHVITKEKLRNDMKCNKQLSTPINNF
jgi:hypothetical protein